MKKWILCLLGCVMGAHLVMANDMWLTSLPDAEAKAKKEGKLVLMDFTGSDWCPWCIKLKNDILSKAEFERYASTNLVLVEVDFPNHIPQSADVKRANAALQSKYNVEGYPTLIVVKPDGQVVLKSVGYIEGGPSALIAKLDDAKAGKAQVN